MKIVRAKVLATGEGKVLVEGSKPGVFTEGLDDNAKEYKADELEILGDSTTMDWPDLGGMPQMPDTAAMMKEVLDSVKSHFWRDQAWRLRRCCCDVAMWIFHRCQKRQRKSYRN